MFSSIIGTAAGLYQKHKEKTIMKTTEEINSDLLTSIEVEYSDMVRRLKKDPSLIEKSDYISDIHHMKDGLVGEVGELVDCLKKHLVYGKDLDYENLIEELGDIEFYLEGIRQIFGLDRKTILSSNNKKLTQRFHAGTYSDQQAQERADKCCGKCQN
jgi:NTP pyrophosphatase (non-canonical NTP hydrolase)